MRPSGRLVVAHDRGDLAGHVGRAEAARVGLDVDGGGAADGERGAQLLDRVGAPRVSTVAVPSVAAAVCTAISTAHSSWLLIV